MTKPKAINRKKLVAFVLSIIRKEKLPMSEESEKLRHKQYVAEHKLTAAKHKEKRLQSELKRLDRSERIHRLCTRAGMLETFLKEPTVLTDEDVKELLTFIFQSEAVQKKLNQAINERKFVEEEKVSGLTKEVVEKYILKIIVHQNGGFEIQYK